MWIQVRLCINENIPVVPVPGPSAVVAAISASGLSTDEFTFGKFCSGTYSCALTVRASFFELFLPYGLPLGSLQLLNMCNVQLDLFLSKLHLEERGWWFQQMRRQLKYSMFLRTNSAVSWGNFTIIWWIKVFHICLSPTYCTDISLRVIYHSSSSSSSTICFNLYNLIINDIWFGTFAGIDCMKILHSSWLS